MLVRIVTARRRGLSAPIGTPALMACAAASSMALPPSACTLTSCTPDIAAAESTAPATVLGMSWNFRSRKMPVPSAAISLTAAGPAAVKSWLPILNMPTRSEIRMANLKAENSESKSRATIRLARGWASKFVVVLSDPDSFAGSMLLFGQFHELEANLAHAGMDQTNFPRDTIGYINFAAFLIGTPVIDAHQRKAAVSAIHDA